MSALCIDASVAIKWVVKEAGTQEALALRNNALIAPDLLTSECANILWKKVQRKELHKNEALLAARLLQGAEIELVPTRSLLEATAQLAIELAHPAYDCVYLALAMERGCRFVTADDRLLRKIAESRRKLLRDTIAPLVSAPN